MLPKLAARFDLAAYLKARYQPHEASIGGDEFQIDHEECGDTKRRLWINTTNRLGWCYKCETAYDLFGLIRYIEGCGLTDAVRLVRDSLPKTTSLDALRKKLDALMSLPEEPDEGPPRRISAPLGHRACADESEWPPYIERRLGSRRLAVKHQIGWCWMGTYANRMIIPIILNGEMVSFAARLMRRKRKDEEKYVPYLYPKKEPGQAGTGQLLFNYDRARHHKTVVLTEGCLDAIHVGDAAMAVLGKNLSHRQLSLLIDSEIEEVVLMLDGDAPGIEAAEKMAVTLAPFFRVRIATLAPGVDPDELPREELRRIVRRAPVHNPARTFRAHVKRGLQRP